MLFLLAAAFPAMGGDGSLEERPWLAAEAEKHWAFQPPLRPSVPPAGHLGRAGRAVRHPVDAFIADTQRELGLVTAPEAGRSTLLRRLTLDLLGLPPTPEEVKAFLADPATDAYETLVERLLASPHYGERWGRHWLDLARWAESDGFEANETRTQAWRYRDYVVNSFNQDKPYDRFLLEQLAGDELEPYADEHLIATGFLAAGRSNNNEEDKLVQLNESLVDMANTAASVTLGLTLNCAQCHDHKFEPLTARDYYAWHGYFIRGQVNNLLLREPVLWEQWSQSLVQQLEPARQLLRQLTDSARRRGQAIGQELSAESSDEKLKTLLGNDDRRLFEELTKKVRALEKEAAERQPQTWGFYSPATSPHVVSNVPPRGMYPFPYAPAKLKTATARVLKRGDVRRPDEEVVPALPAVLRARRGTAQGSPASRLELARWLTSEDSPLTARVWVNFVWQQHFGRGLVASPGDFGLRGARPVLPDLLDWLACELRESGWSTKRLHRLIVTSAAYRRAAQPAAPVPVGAELADAGAVTGAVTVRQEHAELTREREAMEQGENFYVCWVPRRLEGEALRDSMLAVAGRLDRTLGGPSVPVNPPSSRRSLYQLQRRYQLPENESLFDAPVAHESCPRRHVSTVPLQPLHLLNQEFNGRLAASLAARAEAQAAASATPLVETIFRLVLARSPDDTERAATERFFNESRLTGASPAQALADFCQALMNLNEFAYVP